MKRRRHCSVQHLAHSFSNSLWVFGTPTAYNVPSMASNLSKVSFSSTSVSKTSSLPNRYYPLLLSLPPPLIPYRIRFHDFPNSYNIPSLFYISIICDAPSQSAQSVYWKSIHSPMSPILPSRHCLSLPQLKITPLEGLHPKQYSQISWNSWYVDAIRKTDSHCISFLRVSRADALLNAWRNSQCLPFLRGFHFSPSSPSSVTHPLSYPRFSASVSREIASRSLIFEEFDTSLQFWSKSNGKTMWSGNGHSVYASSCSLYHGTHNLTFPFKRPHHNGRQRFYFCTLMYAVLLIYALSVYYRVFLYAQILHNEIITQCIVFTFATTCWAKHCIFFRSIAILAKHSSSLSF